MRWWHDRRPFAFPIAKWLQRRGRAVLRKLLQKMQKFRFKNKANKLTLALESLGVLENLARLTAALLELKAGVTGVFGVLGVAGVRVARGVLDSADLVFLRGLL